jgi:DNA polymerase-3 subunit beta
MQGSNPWAVPNFLITFKGKIKMITTTKKELLNVLNIINKVIPKRSSLPVLEYFLLEVDQQSNKAKFIATNQDIAIKHYFNCTIKYSFNSLINFKHLKDLLKSIKGNPFVSLTQDKLIIDNIEFPLMIVDKGEYLDIPEFMDNFELSNEVAKFTNIDTIELQELKKCLIYVSDDVYRPAMNGILFDTSDNTIKFVATDSFRLYHYNSMKVPCYMPEQDIIVNAQTIELLISINQEFEMLLYLMPGTDFYNTVFKGENTFVYSKCISEKFPPYKAVFNDTYDKFDNEIIIDGKGFLESITTLKPFLNPITKQIKLTFYFNEKPCIYLNASNEDFELNMTIGFDRIDIVRNNCKSIDIGFNYNFLIDSVKSVPEVFSFYFNEPKKPVILCGNNPTNNTADSDYSLVMPVRLKEPKQ